MKPTVSVSVMSRPSGSVDASRRGVERREEHVLGEHLGIGERVEQRRLACVRVADERHAEDTGSAALLALGLACRGDRA